MDDLRIPIVTLYRVIGTNSEGERISGVEWETPDGRNDIDNIELLGILHAAIIWLEHTLTHET